MTSINIPADAMTSIVQKAILEGIDADLRDVIITQAVQYLITPPERTSSYGRTPEPTPLQIAFQNALSGATFQIAHEVVAEDGSLRERVRQLVRDALATAMDEEGGILAKEVSKAVESALNVAQDSWRDR